MPITLTWTGHATWLVDTGRGTLLIDPFFDECTSIDPMIPLSPRHGPFTCRPIG